MLILLVLVLAVTLHSQWVVGSQLNLFFFLDGVNAGTWTTYIVQRGNVGIAGGYALYGIAGHFYKDNKLDTTSYTDYSFSATTEIKGIFGASFFWSPIDYSNDRFGLKSLFNESLRAWSGVNVSAGIGGGAQWSRNFTTFYKK